MIFLSQLFIYVEIYKKNHLTLNNKDAKWTY